MQTSRVPQSAERMQAQVPGREQASLMSQACDAGRPFRRAKGGSKLGGSSSVEKFTRNSHES